MTKFDMIKVVVKRYKDHYMTHPSYFEEVEDLMKAAELAAQWKKGITRPNAVLQEMEEEGVSEEDALSLMKACGYGEDDSVPWVLPYGHKYLPKLSLSDIFKACQEGCLSLETEEGEPFSAFCFENAVVLVKGK